MPFLLALLIAPAAAQEVSEKDYFGDLPVVLSVSRLAQPLDETPGAVTVIDRELIRRSGAREVAEVLRLVPGFLLTYRNGANPQASYHAGMDTYGSRMQVYVDGRSIYSSFYLGDTHVGLRGLVLEDIERIEVLRGSNSASFGANAFLGVVNIVTRNAADTHGVMLSATVGDKGINDNVARVGWGDEKASFRVTGARRVDRGFNNNYDDSHVSRLQLRADLMPTVKDDVMIQFGAGETWRGEGVGTGGNPFRTAGNADAHLLVRWQRQLTPDQQFELRFVHEREFLRDRFIATAGPISALVDTSGEGQRTEIGLQHSLRLDEAMRVVWGGEWRYETARSKPVFFTADTISLHQWRGFGSVEWRPHPQWLLQAGGMYEGHSYTGGTFSPRLTANFHVLPDHTLRAGITKSQRAPTFYELRGDSRLYLLTAPATQVAWTFLASGNVKPETLITNELGYLGRFRQINLSVDARAFVERMNNRVWFSARTVGAFAPNDAVNRPGPRIHGFEYQFDWRPFSGTRLMLAEAHTRIASGDPAEEREAPDRNTSVTWLQRLPGEFEFSAISTATTPFKWAGGGDLINTPRRLDVRLGKPFAMGATRGEVSVTVQAINGGYQVYKMNQRFDRRAFATLRLDF
ncbi:MAG: iron complex outermembrane recepter protein [Rhodocyclaceae bacterium]|nr:MAG: iron complex outermembrane recepter protein [Rhodocyclaceae bacterium]TND03086.1 MAG: iron complex outermembrane recepter protein [Rhodocyclaceae bacterium]